jgi:hypothetical protein
VPIFSGRTLSFASQCGQVVVRFVVTEHPLVASPEIRTSLALTIVRQLNTSRPLVVEICIEHGRTAELFNSGLFPPRLCIRPPPGRGAISLKRSRRRPLRFYTQQQIITTTTARSHLNERSWALRSAIPAGRGIAACGQMSARQSSRQRATTIWRQELQPVVPPDPGKWLLSQS